MARYTIRKQADSDIDEIADYLGRRNVAAGRKFLEIAWQQFDFLSENPGAGPIRQATPPALRGLRSWPLKKFGSYLIFYLRTKDGIDVVRVLHGARNVDHIIEETR